MAQWAYSAGFWYEEEKQADLQGSVMVFEWPSCYANGMEFHSLVTVGEKCGTFGLGRYPPFPLMIHF